ncbi:MAG TPA: hypothetical protein VG055_14135 [Planctomycetaceae bacterium]|jgi:hypothetical protein|nr:hypothetical protein [Planctomycetaceae bacterium]
MWSDFKPIATEIRDLAEKLAISRATPDIYGLTDEGLKKCPDLKRIGMATLLMGGNWERVSFTIDAAKPHSREVYTLLSRAGAAIPNRIRTEVKTASATSAFAWWMAVVFRFSSIGPSQFGVIDCEPTEQSVDLAIYPKEAVEIVGWSWSDPLIASLSAIEAAQLVTPQPDETAPLIGEWSGPMSKAEFARRILSKHNARARDVAAIFDGYEKRQVGPNTWTFRLDKLSDETRSKLEGRKP